MKQSTCHRPQPTRRLKLIATSCILIGITFLYNAQVFLDSILQSAKKGSSFYNDNDNDDDIDYNNQLWDELSPSARQAANTLKWTKITWDASRDSPLHSIQWDKLSKVQKMATIQLGMEADWRSNDRQLDHLHWSELPPKARFAAMKLGYTKKLWNRDEVPLVAKKVWEELTLGERAAAKDLNYDEDTWNEFVGDTMDGASSSGDVTMDSKMEPKKNTLRMKQSTTTEGPPVLNLPPTQSLCKLVGMQVVCQDVPRNQSVTAYPMFADYYTDGNGVQIHKQSTLSARPIATNWFHPNVTKTCGNETYPPCANLGDELGPMLLLKLSGQEYIENRYDGMDVVIIGSVLNFLVKKYDSTVERVGNYFNLTVWGAGTKWKTKGVCFDFRAVRGPKTRDKFIEQGCNVPEVYGDPALLFPHIYQPKKLNLSNADLCLIPHLGDLGEDFAWWMEVNGTSLIRRFSHYDHRANNQTVRVIDIRTPDAAAFIDLLSTCDLVASGSLHGIILAEAYNKTWSWIRLRDKYEDPFKYNDFFLSVGIDKVSTRPLKMKASDPLDKIIEHTTKPKIRGPSLYDPIKLLDACPFCNEEIVRTLKASIMGQ